ncbi:MAG TPA: DUF5995 family protein [Bryobacteraceae bacterium]|jgi:hypothetical protein|nr:DUF5995 family protein [Bryobacteraceae bacterium]
MSPYDTNLLALARANPETIAEVVDALRAIDELLPATDGLKWFNLLYLQLTEAVQTRIAGGGFADPDWIERLDVEFALMYLKTLEALLESRTAPECWGVVFERRGDAMLARIQFALAGSNAHINHDLPLAIIRTCELTGVGPAHGSAQYNDFAALNSTLEALFESAKRTLHVRLPGGALPELSHVEDTVTAWNVTAAREAAWVNAEALWTIRDASLLAGRYMGMLDGITTVIGKSLLVAAT